MRLSVSSPLLRRWPLLGLAALLLALAAALAMALAGTGPASAQDGSDPPAKPTGLSIAIEQGSLDVALDWDDVDGAAHYWVRWRSVDNGEKLNDGIEVETSDASVTVDDYGQWVARVQACNDSGCGEPLAREFTVEPEPSVPGKPANLSVRATPGQFDMSATWDALDGATSYNLAWKPVREDFEPANAATVTSNSADFTVSGYGQWTVRLEGCNDAGCGPSMYYGTGVAPGGPANLAVSAAPGELDLSATWDALDGATLYKLSWRQSDGDFEEGNAIWVSTGGATITVEDYVQWVVRLEGCNDAGCGPPVSRPVEVEPTPAPVDLRLGPSLNDEGQSRPRSFTASWDPVPDASSYTLRWQRNGAEPQTAKQLTAPAEQTSAEFTVSEDGAYDVELKGIGSDGVVGSGRAEMQVQSQRSGHASFYRKGTPYHGCSFAGGIRLEAKPVSGGLELRWSSNNGLIDLYQYQFRRAQQFTEGPDWTDIPGGGDAVSHTFTGLENGKTYFIALRGVVTGWRPCMEWRINVTPTDPSIPALTGFDAVPVPNKSRQIKLFWDDPGDNSLTYQYNQPPISSSGIIRCGPQSPAPKSLRPTARCPTSSQE